MALITGYYQKSNKSVTPKLYTCAYVYRCVCVTWLHRLHYRCANYGDGMSDAASCCLLRLKMHSQRLVWLHDWFILELIEECCKHFIGLIKTESKMVTAMWNICLRQQQEKLMMKSAFIGIRTFFFIKMNRYIDLRGFVNFAVVERKNGEVG